MKCECCGKEHGVHLRGNPMYPYFVSHILMCDECFSKHIVPYEEMKNAINQYEDFNKIPKLVVGIGINTCREKGVQWEDFLKELKSKGEHLCE